ncbi:hypothetical protein TrLO_g1334 [Triparma laevis f. longispina]|uniref:Uncharacterized protein n=1 Tax=Triparma laevis f. longispina TaxID=1714387 RepID=A0A9W7KZM7_9STRA|nr:hypothetical protein TrLO_g1334 [Triparma laevis f. longispina]
MERSSFWVAQDLEIPITGAAGRRAANNARNKEGRGDFAAFAASQRDLSKLNEDADPDYDPDGNIILHVNATHSTRMLPTTLPLNNEWSNKDAKEFGGYDFVRVSIETHRAFSFLVEKASAGLWLHNIAARALVQQDQPHEKAVFRLLQLGDYAMRGYETREEAQAKLAEVGQKVLTYERGVKMANFDILYEWGSYALYRNQVYTELSGMANRANKQWYARQAAQKSIEAMAQKALQHQISVHPSNQTSLEATGQLYLKTYLTKWMKKHEAHKWLIDKGLKHWRIQMRHAAMQREAHQWLESIGVQAVGRELLRAREEQRKRAKQKATERGLLVIKELGNLKDMSVGEIVRRTTNVRDFNTIPKDRMTGMPATMEEQTKLAREKHEANKNQKKKKKKRRDKFPEPRYAPGGENDGLDAEIFGLTNPQTLSRPNSRPGSPVARRQSPVMQTLKSHTMSEAQRQYLNTSPELRDQDSMDLLMSSSAADMLMSKTSVLSHKPVNKDVGRNVDMWSGNNFIGHKKIDIPDAITRHFDARVENRHASVKNTYLMKSKSTGALKKGGVDPTNLPYGYSLKKRIKGLAIYAEEAVSPKHALDRPISPSDFFHERE